MIVDPDFLTHWKTQALREALEDEAAPVYVIALWAHCHSRRTDRFEGIDFATFARICRYPHKNKAPAFFEAMKECGFVETEDDAIIAHGWMEANATLIGRWKGGQTTQSKWLAKAEPIAKPKLSQGDRIGEDRNREEKKESTGAPKSRPAPTDDLEWLAGLRDDPAFKGIDVAREHAKAVRWCQENRRQLSRRFFINWLNKADRALDVKFKPSSTTLKVLPSRPPELTDEQIAKNKAVIQEHVGKLAASMNVPGLASEAV